MNSTLQRLAIAAFLHDIGKVLQRADVAVTPETESLMVSAGPARDGCSSHYHVQWTNQFFEAYFQDCGIDEADAFEDTIARLAFKHHNPSTPLQEIITQADRYSSGMDRHEQQYQRGIHKRKRLTPLRYLLNPSEKPQEPYPKLSLDMLSSKGNANYPRFDLNDEASLVNDYQENVWGGFLRDWQKRQAKGFEPVLAYIDALYERYFSCVPASTVDVIADSSLYEHSRTVSAIAAAMYVYHNQTGTMQSAAVRDDTAEKFLLVSGDLSGIQQYIFSITHAEGKVAKKLRARSFLLGLLSYIIARQILHEVGLPFVNLIINAGGKFHLLLPNTNKTQTVLDVTAGSVQMWLHRAFQGLLSLNLAQVKMGGQDFLKKQIQFKFNALAYELALHKYQPAKRVLQNQSGWNEEAFIMPQAKIQEESFYGTYDISGLAFEEPLGQRLPKSRCLALFTNQEAGEHKLLDWSFTVAQEASEFSARPYCLISFEKGAEATIRFPNVPVHYEYRAANVPAYASYDDQTIAEAVRETEGDIYEGQILSFSTLATLSQGRQALAYLKADVDNLGFLLQKGLDWNEVGWTLSKLTTFSRSLEFFFAGRLRHLLHNRKQGFDKIYTVFTGGDDLLLVGPWNLLHDFSRALQQEWSAYTGHNPHLTLSLGIEVSRPLTPIWTAAEQAEDLLHKAKTEAAGGRPPKNQFCSFGHLIPWEDVPFVFDEIDFLNRQLLNKSNQVSVSFVRSLIYYAHLAALYRDENKLEGLRYLPLLSYNLSRNYSSKNYQALRDWVEKYKQPDGRPMQHLKFIANYVLNFNRGL